MTVWNSILELLRFNSKNWKAVSLCVFAATVFWFFNSLNKNYTTNITFPIVFEYDVQEYIPVQPLPASVRINVTGMGWDLFRRSLGLNVPPLVIPLERPSEVKKIVAVPALFAHQLERFEINFILSDTLRLALESKKERWITLRLDPESIDLRKGYVRTSEPVLKPDSIFVQGPGSLVASFIEPVYLNLAERNIDENYNEDVEVEFVHNELIQRNPPTVEVSFSVDKLVEVSDSIKLMVINYPEAANPVLGIKALPCILAIPQRYLNQYHTDSVRAVIDLRDFERGTRRLLPKVKGLPPYTQVLKIDSIFVKF